MEDEVLTHNGTTFHTRTEKFGDRSVIGEVFVSDVYKLKTTDREIPKVIFDIGGHIGTFSVLAKTLWPDVRIIHVEPNLRSHELAKKNLECFSNVDCVLGALQYDETANLFIDSDKATGGGLMQSEKEWLAEDNWVRLNNYYIHTEEVELFTVESLMKMFNIDSIDILKLDCEGGERGFFTKAEPSTASRISSLLGEYHYSSSEFISDTRRLFADYDMSITPDWSVGTVDSEGTSVANIGIFWGQKPIK